MKEAPMSMGSRIGVVVIGLLSLACPSRLQAANIYVDNTLASNITNGKYSIANRNATGADGNAYVSIQAAVNSMAAGDDIFVRGGTYLEHDIYIPSSKSGTAANWSTLQSYSNEWAVINGQRQCSGSNVHAVLYNGGFAHDGSEVFANYWLFERLEITGGGLAGASVAPAAGIWWVKGPVTVRYCYIHDNLADNADENPAGFNGCSQQSVLLEYNYFKNNGSTTHEHGNSRNICLTGSTEYSSTPFDENWYAKSNEIRFNLVDTSGDEGIATKASQWLTSVRNGTDMSRKTWGDKIHHNIVRNARYGAIFYQQDFAQIYNNIVTMSATAGEEDWGIAVRRIRTPDVDTLHTVVYNNTLIGTDAAAIFNGYDGGSGTPASWWCYNNIIDKHVDDWARNEISVGTEVSSFPTTQLHIDRNYFFRGNNDYVLSVGFTDYTAPTSESAFPGTDEFTRRTENANDPLYVGTTGADQYKTRAAHVVEGTAKTIGTSGIGGAHPYLNGVQFPTYLGAADPNSNQWVDKVLSMTNVSVLKAGDSGTDTIPPAIPKGLVKVP